MNKTSSQIFITGGSGQIGIALRKKLELLGFDVTILAREKSKIKLKNNERYILFKLGDLLTIDCEGSSIILIHLAHDYFDRTSGELNINSVGFTRLLYGFKNYTSLKTIFLSTPMDPDSVASIYQQQKRLGESICDPENSIILKPSFVFSKHDGINKLFHLFSRLRVPLLLPDVTAQIAPCSVNELARLISSEPILGGEKGNFLVVGKANMTLKSYLLRYHDIKTLTLPDHFMTFVLSVLKKIDSDYTFYLSERIVGLQKLKDITELKKSNSFLII